MLEKCKSLLRQVILDALFGQVGLGAEATDIQFLGCDKDCNGQWYMIFKFIFYCFRFL